MVCYFKKHFIRIKNNTFVLSGVLVTVSFIVCFIINGFSVNISNDDLLIEIQLYKGYYDTIFINWFLSAVLIPIQAVFKGINVLGCTQIIANIISIYAIVYTVMERGKRNLLSIIIAIVFMIVFSSFALVHLQWTITAAIAATGGYVVLFFLKSERKIICVIKIIIGCLLLLYSSFLRDSSFLSVSAVFGLIVFILSVSSFVQSRKKVDFSLKKGIIKCIKPIICVFVIILLSYALGVVSENIKVSTISGYSDYKSFNSVRSSAADYGLPAYEDNAEYYNSIGIDSQNDLDVYQTWIHDNEFFTVDKLQKISDYSKRPDVGYKFSVGFVFKLIKNKVSEYTSINPTIIISLICLFLIAFAIMLYRIRNKVKLVFPFILSLMWIAYFYVFRLNSVNCFMIIVALLAIIVSFMYNRYYYILSLALSITSIGLYTYLNFGRPIFRATFTFVFSTIIGLLILISDTKNLRKTKVAYILKNKKTFVIPTIAFAIIISVLFGYIGWGSEVKPKDNSKISNYIIEHNKQCFISSIWQCYDMTTNALLFNDIPDNVIVYGWLDGSAFDKQRKEALSIGSLYRDSLNRDNVFFTTHVNCKELIEKFFNEHYSESIKLKQIKVFDEYGVYSVQEK